MQVVYRKDDNQFIAASVSGVMWVINDFNKCLDKKEKIVKELTKLLEISDWYNEKTEDETGMWERSEKKLEDGIVVEVNCVDYKYIYEEEYGWGDNLRINIFSREYYQWFRDRS